MPQWRASLGSSNRQAPSDAEAMQKAPVAVHHRSACSGVKALRNTSVAKRQAAKLWLAFRSLDLFRALREPDRRRRDEKRPCRSEQKTATNQNDYLTGKAPYKSCELAISRRIADCISRSRTDTLPVHIAVRCPCSCSGGEASSDIRGLSARLNINTPLPLRNLRETALHQRLSGSDDLKPILPAVQRFEPASKCCSISSLTRSGASASGR